MTTDARGESVHCSSSLTLSMHAVGESRRIRPLEFRAVVLDSHPMRNSDLRVDSLFAKPAKVKYSVSALLTPMKISSVCYLHYSLIAALALAPATAQTNQQGSPAPVPYASVSALNTL